MPSFTAPMGHVSHSLDRLHQRPENVRRDSSLLSLGSGSTHHAPIQPPHFPQEPSSSSRNRSRSPSKISHKGHVKLHVAETVVLVHPPETKLEVLGEGVVHQVSQPQEDTVLNGQLEVIMDKPRVARSIRVELVVSCRLQIPGENHWHDREIFTRCVEIGNVDDGEDESQGIKLEKGSQRFEFSIIVPATLATYDRHPLGRILPVIRATVEGFPVQSSHHHHPSFNLFSGMGMGMGMGMGIGKQRDSRSRNRSRPSSRPSSRAPSPNRVPRNGSSSGLPRNGSSSNLMNLPRTGSTSHFRQDLFDASTWTAASTTSSPLTSPGLEPPEFETGDVAFPLPTPTELKPLKGQLFAEKILVVASNPNSTDGEGLTSLSLQKTGRLAGVGDWQLSLTSDAVSSSRCPSDRLSEADHSSSSSSLSSSIFLLGSSR